MSHLEEAILRRFTGLKVILGSIVIGLVGYLPLQLYIWFGPADGNPIGLGLLALAGVLVAVLGVAIGIVKVLVELFGG